MFTGLIERVGTIRARGQQGAGLRLEIAAGPEPFELALGESVAVDGVCLTVTAIAHDSFSLDVSRESRERSTLNTVRVGDRVNLERSLRLGDRLGGHLVAGHVDGLGRMVESRPESDFRLIRVQAPPELMALVVEKGSIAVDGISLTVNAVLGDGFSMTIIPETLARTTLAAKQSGNLVNLETDLIGKYVAKLLGPYARGHKDEALIRKLGEEGFL